MGFWFESPWLLIAFFCSIEFECGKFFFSGFFRGSFFGLTRIDFSLDPGVPFQKANCFALGAVGNPC